MKIVRIEPIVLRAGGDADVTRADGTQDAFLVRVHTDEGLVGIGEADTSPYLARTMIDMPSSHSVARGFAEMLLGRNPLEIEVRWREMYRGSYHYGRAGAALHVISAIDMALWDIAGQSAGLPICDLLGGRGLDRVAVYASEVMPASAADVTRVAERAVEAGYDALKLGWGPLGEDPDHDEALIRTARETLGPARRLMIDGGMAYSVKRARQLLARTSDVDLYWLEEPLAADDYDGYRRLSDSVDVRIAAGEADAGIKPFRALVERGRIDVLQPDLGRCGGFSVARQIAALAAETGVEVVPHCFSTGVLVAASLHLVAALAAPTLAEFSIAASPLVGELLTEPFVLRDGCLEVPRQPGLGVSLDEAVLERLRVA
jgi:L-alanine-DL-glutamate epimerase-like enolase superfamily enzyme